MKQLYEWNKLTFTPSLTETPMILKTDDVTSYLGQIAQVPFYFSGKEYILVWSSKFASIPVPVLEFE